MHSVLRPIFAAAVFWLLLGSGTLAESAPAADEKAIEKLIQQLGADAFAQREAASAELKRIGAAAIPALERASKSAGDFEIRSRTRSLLFQLQPESRPRESFSVESINGDEGLVILKGGYKQILIVSVNGRGAVESQEIDADELWIGALNGEARVALKGKVKKLRIGSINGEAKIDASGLVAGEIEVGEMNGSSEISLQGSAAVVFAGTIAGSSRASVQTAGAIHFLRPIHAGASVQAKTRGDVELERVAGDGKVAILLCRNLKATGEIRDSAQIEAKYFGQAAVTGAPGTKVELTRVAAPQ